MPIGDPVSDTSRGIQHNPDESWPAVVELTLTWHTPAGPLRRTEVISAEQYFGRGPYGAPLPAEFLTMAIERMRRAGPPEPTKPVKPDMRSKPAPSKKTAQKRR